MIQVNRVSQEDTWMILSSIKNKIDAEGHQGCVAIVDEHGEPMEFYRTDGCPMVAVPIAFNKAHTAAREGKTTAVLGQNLKNADLDIAYLGDPKFTGLGGGVPIIVDEKVIGGVGFSGLSPEEDEAMAKHGIKSAGL